MEFGQGVSSRYFLIYFTLGREQTNPAASKKWCLDDGKHETKRKGGKNEKNGADITTDGRSNKISNRIKRKSPDKDKNEKPNWKKRANSTLWGHFLWFVRQFQRQRFKLWAINSPEEKRLDCGRCSKEIGAKEAREEEFPFVSLYYASFRVVDFQ